MGSGNENGNNRSNNVTEGGYCLRWNNHKSNLVEILESLIKMECYVDCTIYVDNHVQFKAHRVVLAACSPYFQLILQDAPQDHCSIIFPGVQEFEMRTLLEYIYAGEVNIAESQIPRIMKIAKMLEVKGLLDMVDLTSNINNQQSSSSDDRERRENVHHPILHSSPIISTSTKISSAQSSSSPPYSQKAQFISSLYQNSNTSRELNPGRQENVEDGNRDQWPALPLPLSRNAQSMLSSVYESGSDMNPLKRKKLSSISSMLMTRDTPILRNVLAQSNVADSSQGTSPNVSFARGGNGGLGESGGSNDNNENNDTNNNENNNGSNSGNTSGGNNGSIYVGYTRKSSDRSYHSSNGSDHSEKKFKDEEPTSPLTDRSFDDEPMHERRTSPPEFLSGIPYLHHQHPSLQQVQFHQHHGNQGGSGQKPEWKRYKQYTRNDIMSAIECVRNGMSALQASRKFGVPSRTLYDKVKKLGITTGTPRNRSSGKRDGREGGSSAGPSSSIAAFPYGSLSGAGGPFNVYPNQDSQLSQSQDFDDDEIKHHQRPPHPVSLLDPVFLQKALEARGEDFRGDALQAMALAAAAHAQLNGLGGQSSSHTQRDLQSPSMLTKYMNRNFENEMLRERERDRDRDRDRNSTNGAERASIKKEPVASDDEMEASEKAENLSISKQRDESPSVTPPSFNGPPTRGVIVQPPLKYMSPRSEPTSTTPPSNDQPLALDSSAKVAETSLIPTTMANYDD